MNVNVKRMLLRDISKSLEALFNYILGLKKSFAVVSKFLSSLTIFILHSVISLQPVSPNVGLKLWIAFPDGGWTLRNFSGQIISYLQRTDIFLPPDLQEIKIV